MSALSEKKKIQGIDLPRLNFELDSSCEILIDLIDTYPDLEFLKITDQMPDEGRKVKVEIIAAGTVSYVGLIKVTDAKSGAVICQRQT